MTDATSLGRTLGQQLTTALQPPPTPTTRYGTITSIKQTNGQLVADITVSGAALAAIPVMANVAPYLDIGCRVMVQTFNHLSAVTGVVGNAAASALAFDWSSTWTGTPSGNKYTETTQKVFLSGLTQCQVFARVAGTGEYGFGFEFLQDGVRKAYWCATSPQKNGGTLNFSASGVVKLPPGEYDVTLTSNCWGSVTVGAPDSSADTLSKRFRDQTTGADGVGRYARLVRL